MSQPISENELAAWKLETFRITFFPAPEATLDGRKWWQESIGTIADLVEEKRDQLSILGEFRNGLLSQKSNTERTDWHYNKAISESATFEDDVAFVAAIEPLIRGTMEAIAEKSPPVLRIAFGAVLIRHTDNIEESYKILSKFTGLNLEASQCSEFVCRLNRWKSSDLIPELRVNQLRDISAFIRQQVQFRAGTGSTGSRVILDPKNLSTGCRLLLDINTDAERSEPLPTSQIPELFRELIELAVQISEQERLP